MARRTPVAAPAAAAKVAKAAKAAVAVKPAALAKPAVPAQPVKAAKPVESALATKPPKVAKPIKPIKLKLVRDSFAMPTAEYELIAAIKQRLLKLGHAAKKSEVLRAGVALLNRADDPALLAALADVPHVKTGRPKLITKVAGEPPKKSRHKG